MGTVDGYERRVAPVLCCRTSAVKRTVSVRCGPVLATPSDASWRQSRPPNPLSKADASIRRSPSTFPRGHRPASTVGDQTSWDSVLSTYVKENFMRFWKPRLALASSAAAGLALAAALVVPRAVIDVLLMIIIVCTLVGLYLLRRYARAELLLPPPR